MVVKYKGPNQPLHEDGSDDMAGSHLRKNLDIRECGRAQGRVWSAKEVFVVGDEFR